MPLVRGHQAWQVNREYDECLLSVDNARTISSGKYTETLTSETCDENIFGEKYARAVSSEDYDENMSGKGETNR